MQYQVYKPNSKNAGSAFSFSIGQVQGGKPAIFVNAVQQASWNDKEKIGSFKENAKDPQKSTTIMLNANEAGEMLSSIKSRIPVTFFHKTPENSSIITFSPWDKDRTIKERTGDKVYKSPAFGLSISKNSTLQFKIALEAGEAEVLSFLLKDFVNQSLFYAGQSYKDNRESTPSQPAQPKAQEPTPAENFDDDSDVPF